MSIIDGGARTSGAGGLDGLDALLGEYRDGELTDRGLVAALRRLLLAAGRDPAEAGAVLVAHGLGAVAAPVPPVAPAPGRRGGGRVRWAVLGVVVALLAAAAGAAWWWSGKPDRDYLDSVRSSGLAGEFPSDAAALAHARSVCAALESGGPAQGAPVDAVAVAAYCPQFVGGFHVLRTAEISGSLTLRDSDIYSSGITEHGGICEGAGGYSDIHPGAGVVVTGADGSTLATTTLGLGTGSLVECTFPFTVTLTEGDSDYAVEVTHRGKVHETWEGLAGHGFALTLGD